jgi:hypothetical protein
MKILMSNDNGMIDTIEVIENTSNRLEAIFNYAINNNVTKIEIVK